MTGKIRFQARQLRAIEKNLTFGDWYLKDETIKKVMKILRSWK